MRRNTFNNKYLDEFAERIKIIMDKSKCYDIFQTTKVGNVRMYSQKRTIKDIIFYSMEIKQMEKKIKNIQLIRKMCPKLLTGYKNLTYIKLTLKEIQLAKKLFVHNIELGDEVIIPG